MNAIRSASEIRHRLLEGVLLRLSRLPGVGQFALRGGVLMRLWFRPLVRHAGDLDLAATFPFDITGAARQLVPILSDQDAGDGIRFDPERYRVEGIWLDTPFPGVRMFGSGEVDGVEDDFSVDVTFGEELVPAPEWADYPVAGGAKVARLLMCRPETIAGRKMHALAQMGTQHWRAKDLNDLRLLLTRTRMELDALALAIASSFTSRGNTTADARMLFRNAWWSRKSSAARWQDFVTGGGGPEAAGTLAQNVAEVAALLKPVLDCLP